MSIKYLILGIACYFFPWFGIPLLVGLFFWDISRYYREGKIISEFRKHSR